MRYPKVSIVFIIALLMGWISELRAQDYKVGVYYFPGWASTSSYWNDLRGAVGSRSPGVSWTDREPLRGFGYSEESRSIAEQNIEWASSHGISFFAYDWYWDGTKPLYNHAITNHKLAQNKEKLKYCVMWANHMSSPQTLDEFERMITHWIDNYFTDSQYFKINNMPVVIIFSPQQLRDKSKNLHKTTADLLGYARSLALRRGISGIYFVATTYAHPYWVVDYLPSSGYDALTAYNYQSKGFSGAYSGGEDYSTSYQELLAGYKSQWKWIIDNSTLPYIVPMSAGWDRRPWGGSKVAKHDNSGSNPLSFKDMLLAGKDIMDKYPKNTLRMGIIYAWNEFGEGAYIEPTKRWGFKYLEAIKDVFGNTNKIGGN